MISRGRWIILYYLIVCYAYPCFAQNDLPLSFDPKTPFSNIRAYALRGDDFFYERLYENLKRNYDKKAIMRVDYNQSSPKSYLKKNNDPGLIPSAGDFNMLIKISARDTNIMFMAHGASRSYNYFMSQDVDGALTSNMISLGLGVYEAGTSFLIFYTARFDSHTYSKKAKWLPSDLRTIYKQRYNEINSRLKQSDFKEFERDAVALAGYSHELGGGFVVAVGAWRLDYLNIDADVLSLAMSVAGFTYTQAAWNITRTASRIMKKDFTEFFRYRAVANFAGRYFSRSKNVISDAEANLTRFIGNDRTARDYPLKVTAQYDHRKKRWASVGGSARFTLPLTVGAAFIGYGYDWINPKVFQPTRDRLYSSRHSISIGIEI